jgi:CheY-like chemotaxis protein/HPt (histidine-containing phosphotransfer) domain-containing protein
MVDSQSTKPLTVLVVEDNEVNRRLAVKQLERLGYAAVAAAGGAQALEALEESPVSLVLMDIQMPDMDGYETTRRIRALEASRGQRVPIVALTANARTSDRDEGIAAGMDDYISKPVMLETLRGVLERWAGSPSAADATTTAVDSGVLARLRNDIGGQEGLCELVAIYLGDLDERIETIGKSVRASDAKSLRLAAHTLKSTSLSLGATTLAAMCESLEAGAERGSGWSIDVSYLSSEAARVRTALKAECDSSP